MLLRRRSTASDSPVSGAGFARRATAGGVVVATLCACASVGALTATPASARPTTRSTAAPAIPAPQPQALAAQSANFPFAQQILGRFDPSAPPSDADAAPIAAQIDAGQPVTEVVERVARSWHGISKTITEDAYPKLLHRSADAGGQTYYTSQVGTGRSIEWVFANMASTPEFRAVNPSVASRVNAIYAVMLGRAADSSGLAYYAGLIADGMPVDRVVYALKGSPEYAQRTIDNGYRRILLRAADVAGRAHWKPLIGSLGQIGLDVSLGASAESQQYGCDPLASGTCMLPWPNDYYTRADPATATGLRVNLKAGELPATAGGTHISPVQLNRSDGFSPGSTMIVQIPGIDVEQSGLPTIDHLDRNGPAAPIQLVDEADGSTVPVWAELDLHADYPDPTLRPLLIHPVKNLADGHHYAIALRGLKNAAGEPLPAPPVFAAYRDGTTNPVAGFAARTAHMDQLFTTLGNAGISRSNLFLAWDFTVASTANLTGRLLHLRDDAFSRLGSASPSFTVTSNTPGTHAGIARVIDGTFQVPNYLTGTGAPGSTFNEDASGLPQANGTFTAPFRCVIPSSALTTPARPSLYGHGLFGSDNEVTAGNVQDMAAEHNMVFCGTNWAGMSNEDIGTAAGVLTDLSNFNKLADRLQQGVLNFLFLGRAMKLANGLVSDPAFQNSSGDPVLATGQLYYDGNSQGGIEGGILTSVATDWTRSVLGVSAINYSMLLPRSTDFTTYESVMIPAYPAELDRVLGLAAIQLEWDRAEPDGYANHMTTDPLPGTPQHTVLMQIALGDHQVSDYAADTEARTIGAQAHCPAFDAGRVPDTRLLWGVPCIASYPYGGSAIVYFDSGSALPLLTNTPPTSGHDPHEDPRHDPQGRNQKSAFLQNDGGAVIDVCGGAACHAEQD